MPAGCGGVWHDPHCRGDAIPLDAHGGPADRPAEAQDQVAVPATVGHLGCTERHIGPPGPHCLGSSVAPLTQFYPLNHVNLPWRSSPVVHGSAGELASIVRTQDLGLRPTICPSAENRRHVLAREGEAYFRHGTNPAKVIYSRHDPHPAPIGEPIGHKVHAPPLVRSLRCGHWHPYCGNAVLAALEPKREPFLAVDAIDPLVVDLEAFFGKQHVKRAVAIANPCLGQVSQADPKSRLSLAWVS